MLRSSSLNTTILKSKSGGHKVTTTLPLSPHPQQSDFVMRFLK